MFEDDDVTLSEVPEEDIDAANLHILHELEEVWMLQSLFTAHSRWCYHNIMCWKFVFKKICMNFSHQISRTAGVNGFNVSNVKAAISRYLRKHWRMLHRDINKDVDCFISVHNLLNLEFDIMEEKNKHTNLKKSSSFLFILNWNWKKCDYQTNILFWCCTILYLIMNITSMVTIFTC